MLYRDRLVVPDDRESCEPNRVSTQRRTVV
jgi:hypothetical protein